MIAIAILANPTNLSGIQTPLNTPPPTVVPVTTFIPIANVTPTEILTVTPTPRVPDAPPYQIFYTDNPFAYPNYKIPEEMVSFGSTDILFRDANMVPFAFVEDTRGGLTQTFSVPYPLWALNTTVIANRTPQYGNFRMVLSYASDGTIIEGEEILNRGSTYRIVQVSNTDMYMIISTSGIDSYRITLETPRRYYDEYRPR